MQKTEVQQELDKFRDYVISQSRRNLSRLKKNSSKKLYNSIKGNVKAMPNSISIQFSMEDYGVFQDAGVSGTKKKYNTPYSYKSRGGKNGLKGMPPPNAFDKWIVRKGLAPRKSGGQFASRKSLAFLIARSVFRNGIKPSLFFTKPFEAAYKRLPEELVEKYGVDALKLFNQQIDQILKQNG
jgi:hypothetical protein